jgi:hypothetical protein
MSVSFISYPSGGFGNFLYHVLSEFADRTVKPKNSNFSFSNTGNSHSTTQYTCPWIKDPVKYNIGFDCPEDKISLVLCDNGINNDSYTQLRARFANPSILRVNIDYAVRPVVYQTCVAKAMRTSIVGENAHNVTNSWGTSEDYAVRENFTLFYHNWPFRWEPDPTCYNISLEQLITQPVETISKIIVDLGCNVIRQDELASLCNEWMNTKNSSYFSIYHQWRAIEQSLTSGPNYNLEHIDDLHLQGYINYRLEKMYNCTIPVYDFRNWFCDTNQILTNLNEAKFISNQ